MSAHQSRTGKIYHFLSLCIFMLGAWFPLSSFATEYIFSYVPCGDTCQVSDINNNGDIVMTSFDFGSRLLRRDKSMDFIEFPDSPHRFRVDNINDDGDMLGHWDQGLIIWIAGIPYDMSKPENAAITFVDNHPSHVVEHIDLFALSPTGWTCPSMYISDCETTFSDVPGLANDVGEIVLNIGHNFFFPEDSYALLTPLPSSIPEPASLVLVGIGLAALGGLRRRKQPS